MKTLLNRKALIFIVFLGLVFVVSLAPYLDCYGKMRLRIFETVPLEEFSLSSLTCGSKKPTVIFEAGLNIYKGSYFGLQQRIFPHAKVVTYEHAGIGGSTKSGNPRTLPYYVEELKALLAYKKLDPPYILIGHSLGGHIIRYFTYLYPDEVAGLVFLDHPHEDWFRYIRANWSIEEQEEYFKIWNPEITSESPVNLIERTEYDHNGEFIRGKIIPKNIPVLMFTGVNARHFRKDDVGKAEDMHAYAKMQLSLIYHLDNAKQIIDWETGHSPQRDKPEEVAREINAFIEKIKRTM